MVEIAVAVGDQVILSRKTYGGVKKTLEFEVASSWPGGASEAAFVVDGDRNKYYLNEWSVEVVNADLPEWEITIRYTVDGVVYARGATADDAMARLRAEYSGSLPQMMECDDYEYTDKWVNDVKAVG